MYLCELMSHLSDLSLNRSTLDIYFVIPFVIEKILIEAKILISYVQKCNETISHAGNNYDNIVFLGSLMHNILQHTVTCFNRRDYTSTVNI